MKPATEAGKREIISIADALAMKGGLKRSVAAKVLIADAVGTKCELKESVAAKVMASLAENATA